MEIKEEVVIVGAGIAGLATAVALKRIGIKALVLERAEELRTTGAALTLFPNAWLALDALGVAHKLTSIYSIIPKGSVTNVATGAVQEVFLTRDGKSETGPRPVHRKVLLEALAEELPVDTIRFDSKLLTIETREDGGASSVLVHLEGGTTINAKVLIGCDGVHSIVANWLGLAKPVHSGRSAVRGLAHYPDGHGFGQDVRQFVDVGKRAGFATINDKEIYWFYVGLPTSEGEKLLTPEQMQNEVIENYAKNFPSAYLSVVRNADLSSVSWAPLMLRYPWNIILGNLSKGNITVAGDAMHPMTPDLGQGGCAALEDAVVLARHIGNEFLQNGRTLPSDMSNALAAYVKERMWRTAFLVAGSYLSGAVQQGTKWWLTFVRDFIFYKFIFARLRKAVDYDCGKLPTTLEGESNESNYKQD